ncbi:hypothetical protein [Streptosporangium sp. NPDC049078]|uniref:hypothetical protein n=1 Tax=Streptosporangium sp. NPDC049078 TaxID=3155767 RepID=UPI003430E021
MKIAAIETRYAGCRFRSRLEARWAVFFDHLGIAWEYEPQGFIVDGTPYLPDFWLPETKTWVEVKGDEESFQEHAALYAKAAGSGALPDTTDAECSTRGLLILGPIPRVEAEQYPVHVLLRDAADYGTPWKGHQKFWSEIHAEAWLFGHGSEHDPTGPMVFCTDLASTDLDRPLMLPELPSGQTYTGGHVLKNYGECPVRPAYIAARSARFEHGESGA